MLLRSPGPISPDTYSGHIRRRALCPNRLRNGMSQRSSSSRQSDILPTMVGPSKSRPPMSHRKTDLGIPCRSKSAKVVLVLMAMQKGKKPRPTGGTEPRKVGVPIFHAKAIRVAANWFHLPEKKNPAARPLACGVSSNTPEFLRREAPAFKGGHQVAVPC